MTTLLGTMVFAGIVMTNLYFYVYTGVAFSTLRPRKKKMAAI